MADHAQDTRSYGCSFGDGNPYDFILISVRGGDTLFLCLPCFVSTTADMVKAVLQPGDPEVSGKISAAGSMPQVPMSGNGVRGRGKNAPAENDDPDIFEAFDSRIVADDLGGEFR